MSLVGYMNSKQELRGAIAIRQGIDGKDGEKGEQGEVSLAYADIHYSPAIYSRASGEVVATTDSAKAKPKNIRLYGKSEQKKYKGYQLIDESMTQVFNNNNYLLGTVPALPNTEYTWSMGILSGDGNVHERDADGNNIATHSIKGATFTTLENCAFIYFQCAVTTDGTASFEKAKPMLNYGSVAYPFEPYTYGQPSPSVNIPQPINHLGESGSIVGKVLSGNIYNPSWRGTWAGKEIYAQGCIATEKDGVFTIVANREDIHIWDIATRYHTNYSGQLLQIPNGVTKISFLLSNVELNKNYIILYDENLDNIKTNTISSNKATVPVVEGAKYFGLRFGKGDAVVGTTYETTVMVNYGEPMDYEPYTEQPFTVLTPNGLKGIGDVRDYVDFERGKFVQNIARHYITANDNIGKSGMSTDELSIFYLDMQIVKASEGGKASHIMSNIASQGIFQTFNVLNTVFTGGNGGDQPYFCVSSDVATTVEEFKTLCIEKGAYFDYVLKEPIETDLTEEEMAQYNALVMNYPNTTFINDANAHMEVEYVADTKIYIDNKFKEMTSVVAQLL